MNDLIRRLVWFLFLLFGSLQCAAQSAPATPNASTASSSAETVPGVSFVSRSQLVLVPVVVTRDGQAVTGLKKQDFKVFENGRDQKVSVFEEIKADSSPIKVDLKSNPAQRQFSNMQVDQNAPKRLIVIVLDLINIRFGDRVNARQKLIKYLASSVDKGALVALVALGRGRISVIHDFTSDPSLLVAALNQATGTNSNRSLMNSDLPPEESAVFENEVNEISDFLETGNVTGQPFGSTAESGYKWLRIRQTLDGMNLIAQAYAGVPGRKSMIWLTGGFPFQIDGSTMLLDAGGLRDAGTADMSDILTYYQQTWKLMNDANFAVYPVDVRGVITPTIFGADQAVEGRNVVRQMQRQKFQDHDTLAALRTFADMTGGHAFDNTNDLAACLKKASMDSANYYLLAYYLQNSPNDKKESWHKLKVKVEVRGAIVRTRSGFFVTADSRTAYKNETALALASPLDFTALPVTVRWIDPTDGSTPSTASGSTNSESKKKTVFEVLLPPNTVTIDTSDQNGISLEVVASARTGQGAEAKNIAKLITGHLQPKNVEQMRTSGFLFKGGMDLPPGQYLVRFVVHDYLSGRTGSVAAPVTVK